MVSLALYKNGVLVSVWDNVLNVIVDENRNIEVYVESANMEVKFDIYHKDYDKFEVWLRR